MSGGPVFTEHVQVWTNQAGQQVAPPLSGSEVFITAVLGGVLWESAALAALGGVYLISRHLLGLELLRNRKQRNEVGGS